MKSNSHSKTTSADTFFTHDNRNRTPSKSGITIHNSGNARKSQADEKMHQNKSDNADISKHLHPDYD